MIVALIASFVLCNVFYRLGVRRGKAQFAKASVLRRVEACSHSEGGSSKLGGYPQRRCTCVR